MVQSNVVKSYIKVKDLKIESQCMYGLYGIL